MKGMQAFIIMPNINRHTDKLHLLCSKDAEKRRLSKAPEGGGISFTVWTIHPSILQGKIMDEADGDAENPEVHSPHLFMGTQKRLETVKEGMSHAKEDVAPLLARLQTKDLRGLKATDPEAKQRLKKTRSGQTPVADLEAASGNKYLVTILDLTRNELPFLRGLRSAAELRECRNGRLGPLTVAATLTRPFLRTDMRNWYEYDEHSDDILQLYFHFPTSDVTSTLHMHVTLNRDTSPLESRESYGLDEIIDWLQVPGHDDCFGLVMKHQQQEERLLLDCYCDVVEAWEKSLREEGVAEAGMPVTMTHGDVDKHWAATGESPPNGRPIFTPKAAAEALPPAPTSAKLSPQTDLAPLLEVSAELERGASSGSVLSAVLTSPSEPSESPRASGVKLTDTGADAPPLDASAAQLWAELQKAQGRLRTLTARVDALEAAI